MNRVLLMRYSVTERESTGALVGRTEILTTTQTKWRQDGQNLKMQMSGDRLTIDRYTGLYSDYFAPGGKYYPGASHIHEELHVKDGKLHKTSVVETWEIDTKTLGKTLVEKSGKPTEVETRRLPVD